MAQNTIYQKELLELVFATRSKEYGAYVLRRLYGRHIKIAMFTAITLFTFAVSIPLILNNTNTPVSHDRLGLKQTTISISDATLEKAKTFIPKIEVPLPVKAMVKFLVPVIRKDADVQDGYVPAQGEFKNADVGKATVAGAADGVSQVVLEVPVPQAEVKRVETVAPVIYQYAEVMPTFANGGDEAFLSYLAANIKYPEMAKRAGIEGRVIAQFIVGKNGEISGITIVKSVSADCDEEAIRVLKSMPAWKPGRQNGLPVSVKMSVPINFRLR